MRIIQVLSENNFRFSRRVYRWEICPCHSKLIKHIRSDLKNYSYGAPLYSRNREATSPVLQSHACGEGWKALWIPAQHSFPRCHQASPSVLHITIISACLIICPAHFTDSNDCFYRAAWNADVVLRWEFCPSVRLSVRLSNACIVRKRKKAMFRFLYHTKEHLS